MGALAAEIAYDRALIRMCEIHGIDVALTNFAYPKSERARIERMLALAGVDLAGLASATATGSRIVPE
jgi:hypothetical protein